MTDNILFSFINDVAEISEPFFKDVNLNFFGHITVYPDGRYNFLCSKHGWPKSFVKQKIPPMGFTFYDTIVDCVRFPSMDNGTDFGWSDEATRQAKEEFNITNPMVILHKFHDHYEGFIFDLHCENVYEKYLTQFDQFEKFMHYFKERTQKLHHKIMGSPLMVDDKYLLKPDFQQADSNEASCIDLNQISQPKKYFLRHNGMQIVVGKNEYACLSLLAHGKSLKGIAMALNISARTVETHLNRIKTKFNINTKEGLVAVYWHNKLLRTTASN